MSEITVKHKNYEVIDKLGDHSTLVSYKGKKYVAYQYEPKSKEFDIALFRLHIISSSFVRTPKIKAVDKKRGIILREYIEGPTICDLLSKKDLDEKIYQKIFTSAWALKASKMIFNFNPDLWILNDNELFYVGSELHDYSEPNDFANKGVRLWFFTKEFVDFASKRKYELDLNRLKESYVINKEILLIACKYYQ